MSPLDTQDDDLHADGLPLHKACILILVVALLFGDGAWRELYAYVQYGRLDPLGVPLLLIGTWAVIRYGRELYRCIARLTSVE